MTIATVPSKTATPFIVGMRDRFFNRLYEHFKRDKRCVMLTADNGAPSLDQFGDNLPDQFYQCGIAEQQMLGLACGMATEGWRCFCYALAPFVGCRIAEFVKLDACAMRLPIGLISVGVSHAYDVMGPTHSAAGDVALMRALPNIHIYTPADGVAAAAIADEVVVVDNPQYIRLDRTGIPDIYPPGMDWSKGVVLPVSSCDTIIVTAGVMVHQARKVIEEIPNCAVADLFRMKPVGEGLVDYLKYRCKRVVSLEEDRPCGALGGLVAELMADNGICKPLLRIATKDEFEFSLGGRESIWRKHGLDLPTVVKRIREWMN